MNHFPAITALGVLAFAATLPVQQTSQEEFRTPRSPGTAMDDFEVSTEVIGQDPPNSGGRVVDEVDPRVWCLHEGENGEMWFGTNGAGVFRRTGDQLIQYTKEHGLTGNQVRHVLSDRAGGVLVIANRGVSRFDGTSFAPLEVEKYTGEGGWRLDPNDVWFVVDIGAGSVCRFDAQKVYQLELPESRAGGPKRKDSDLEWYDPIGVYRVTKDRRGHVWIGTAGAGLCRYNGKSVDWMYEKRLTTTPSGGEFGIRSIYQDRSGDYWICNTRQRFDVAAEGRDRLLSYTTKQGVPDAATDDAANFAYFPAIVQAKDGALWMACGSKGVMRYDGETVAWHSLGKGAYAMSILIDQTGAVWVGTLEHGAFRLDEGEFQSFRGSSTSASGGHQDQELRR